MHVLLNILLMVQKFCVNQLSLGESPIIYDGFLCIQKVVGLGISEPSTVEQWKKPGCLGYLVDYNPQLYGDSNQPL